MAIYYVTRAILNIIRSIEPLIWAIIFSVWVGIGPFAGMLALIDRFDPGLSGAFLRYDDSPSGWEIRRATTYGDSGTVVVNSVQLLASV